MSATIAYQLASNDSASYPYDRDSRSDTARTVAVLERPAVGQVRHIPSRRGIAIAQRDYEGR